MSTKVNTPIKLKRLVQCSILYLGCASIGGVVAIVLNRPAQFGGSSSGLPVVQDFIYGSGTAMSPPLLWWLVPQGLLTWLAWNQTNRRSTWGVIGLTLAGAATLIGAVGEPITYELLNPVTFNPLVAVVQAGMVIIPLVMMVFGIQEWRRRRSETKQKENPAFPDPLDRTSRSTHFWVMPPLIGTLTSRRSFVACVLAKRPRCHHPEALQSARTARHQRRATRLPPPGTVGARSRLPQAMIMNCLLITVAEDGFFFEEPGDLSLRRSQAIVRSYLVLTGLFTLAASLMWAVNALFLLDAGLDISRSSSSTPPSLSVWCCSRFQQGWSLTAPAAGGRSCSACSS